VTIAEKFCSMICVRRKGSTFGFLFGCGETDCAGGGKKMNQEKFSSQLLKWHSAWNKRTGKWRETSFTSACFSNVREQRGKTGFWVPSPPRSRGNRQTFLWLAKFCGIA